MESLKFQAGLKKPFERDMIVVEPSVDWLNPRLPGKRDVV